MRSTHHKRMRPNLTARQSVGAGNDTRPPWFWSVSLTETQVDIYSCSDGFLYYLIVLGCFRYLFCRFRNCASLFIWKHCDSTWHWSVQSEVQRTFSMFQLQLRRRVSRCFSSVEVDVSHILPRFNSSVRLAQVGGSVEWRAFWTWFSGNETRHTDLTATEPRNHGEYIKEIIPKWP